MQIPIFQLDAFSSRIFSGNPAAVCPLERWLPDEVLQAIAAENNLSETAFLVRAGSEYEIRWMTPTVEVDLCGHATLASGWVVLNRLEPSRGAVVFGSKSGALHVRRAGDLLRMDFPAHASEPAPANPLLERALGARPREVLRSSSTVAVLGSEEEIRALRPDFALVREVDPHAVIATAPGDGCDFVSRFFAPAVGIPEDPVTGSAHCVLTPFWAARLAKKTLHARQLSARGGELFCEALGERVGISGQAVLYLEGSIRVPT
jgi:PhzF family phenazine biosynthesis protein